MNVAAVRALAGRLESREPSPLVPSRSRDAAIDREIEALAGADAPDLARAVQSALFLWNDHLERAHALAQPARLEVIDQRAQGIIERHQLGWEAVGQRPAHAQVMVPAAVGDQHDARPVRDQPPGQEARLPERVAAVAIAQRRRLARQVEGRARPRILGERPRLRLEAVARRLGRRARRAGSWP